MTLFCNTKTSSARLSHNNLVLSLPDAITPVVWMIDTKASGSFFVRVEKDDNGLFILQKVEGTGNAVKIEDIAFYSDKKKAVSAMAKIGQIQDFSDASHKQSSFTKTLLKIIVTAIVLAGLALLGLIALGRGWIIDNENTLTAEQTSVDTTPPPYVESNSDALGVPLSADDFMNQRGPSGLPF